MRVELRTKIKWRRNGEPDYVMEWHLLPRGGGNRSRCSELAREIRGNVHMAPHIRSVKVWTSRVDVHFKPSVALAVDLVKLVSTVELYQQERNEPTLPLFPSAVSKSRQ